MALDTTIGGEAADSYAALVEADAYHESRGFNDAWTAATDSEKEKALKWAARLMDTHFNFRGVRTAREQARAWPRMFVVDPDGWDIYSDVIPQLVKDAQAEWAFQLIGQDWTQGIGPVTDAGVQIGNLKTTKEEHHPVPDSVRRLIAPLTNGGGPGIRSIPMKMG